MNSADLGDGTYRNPVLNADWSGPDLIRVGDDFSLTASSFGRAPGLPLLHSVELRLDSEEPGARAGLAVLGDAFSWIGLQRGTDGSVRLVHRFAESVAMGAPPPPLGQWGKERDAAHAWLAPGGRARLWIEIGAGARCRFSYDVGDGRRPSGQVFAATPWRWVGALIGLVALAPVGGGHAGAATFTRFRSIASASVSASV